MKIIFSLFSLSIILSACTSIRQSNSTSYTKPHDAPSVQVASPPVIVYKTTENYYYEVPVLLSDDKSQIVSYPHPSDLKCNGTFSLPTKLANGYLLDNRGINEHAAFLKFTYENYCNMDNIPTPERLIGYIIDFIPFTEMYDCGRKNDFDDVTKELNSMILNGDLSRCKDLINKNK